MLSFASSRSEEPPSGTRSLRSKPILGVTCLSFVLIVYETLQDST
jgi:hypothetical protein